MSDEWDTDVAPSGNTGGGSGDSGCRKCGEDGHFARDCPSAPKDSGCRKCGQDGHMARDCEIPDKCRKCNEEGHMARDCSLPDKCRRCGEEGHMAKECSQEEQTRQITGEDGEVREIYVPKAIGDEELFETGISSGINFSKYESIPVDVKGDNKPSPIKTFDTANLRQLLLDNVKKAGYKVPTPIQKYAIPIIGEKRDLIACAQTGSGKTAAFLIPVINNLLAEQPDSKAGSSCQTPQVLVITPTRELAIQIWEQARKFTYGSSLKSVIVYGGTSVGAQRSKLERGGCNILVGTPGRLLDFVEKGYVSYSELKYFILDEADRMLDMGFGPDIAKCMEHHTMPSKESRNTLMFSATFPADVQGTAREYMKKDKIFMSVGMVGAACSDVKQTFIACDRKEKKTKLIEVVDDPERDPSERMLIFVNTKKQADFLATFISGSGKPATTIHGDRLQREREEVLHDFKTGKRPIMVATAVAARGLDIPGVQKVVNYDLPSEVDEYVHRIGRTGRVGNIGSAVSFYDAESDSGMVGPLVTMLEACKVEVPDFMADGGSGGADNAGGGDEDEEW